jgi:two-component system sensor histidine kinase CpxA
VRSLFSRIFISFWLVLAVITASCIGVTAAVAWQRMSTLGRFNSQDLARDAGTALRSGGETGLTVWLKRARGSYPGIEIYILDPVGRDILRRAVPGRLRQWLTLVERRQRVAVSPRGPIAPEFQFSATHLLDRQEISGADGRRYVLAIAWFGSSPIDVLGSYDVTVMLILLAISISAAASWMLGRYISDPVRKLQMSARVLAAGDLDTQVDRRVAARRDEIGVLARDFNHMAAELKSQIVAKEVLLRDVSHELRSPLSRIQIALGLAGLDPAETPVQLRRIERDVERMNVLIGEIIQLARLTSSAPAFAFEPVSLGDLLDEVADDAALEARSVGKTVSSDSAGGFEIHANRELLRRALENVVRNAIRFSPPGGQVSIAVTRGERALTVAVRDKGPGVPEADRERIFEPFYRVSQAREHSGGVGLGLAITARVMDLHGGNARAFNAREGGLVVELQLPVTDS